MPQNQTLYESLIELNGQAIVRTYTAEIQNFITQGKKKEHSSIAMFFTMQYIGINANENLEYHLKVNKRLFLDDRTRTIFKLSKAQKIALTVAKINDDLILEVSKNYELIGIINTEEVQKKWQAVKSVLLESFSDLQTLIDDFDWQMQTENIQKAYKNDVFYNFFFSNFFYQEFDENKSLEHKKILANGIHNLDIPILEKKAIAKQDVLFQNISISTSAELAIKDNLFPLEKVNLFLGDLLGAKGSKHSLDFNYDGSYSVRPRIGLVTEGNLEYSFSIKDVYTKKTTLNFNLEKDE